MKRIEQIDNINTPAYKEVKMFYAKLVKDVLIDLRKNKKESVFFARFKKDEVVKWLKSPEKYENQLVEACVFLYSVSGHFKRLIDYFAKMPTYSSIVVPLDLNTSEIDKDKFLKDYFYVLSYIEKLNIPHEFLKVGISAFREDVFYGYCYETNDSFYIKKLPFKYCRISSVVDGVYNFQFDFRYFDKRIDELENFGKEFEIKYELYKNLAKNKDSTNKDPYWIELDYKNTICIKLNEDLPFIMPFFAGVLVELYDIEDYKALQKARAEIDNTNIIAYEVPKTSDNEIAISESMCRKFSEEISKQLPEIIGYTVTPFKATAFSFKNTNNSIDDVANAESAFWRSTGVSDLNFNGNKSSSAVMLYSIKSDFDIIVAYLRQVERWINRRIKLLNLKHKFKISMLNVTRFNQKEVFDMYLKAGERGVPVKQAIAATLGYSPSDIIAMSYLENDVLNMRNTLYSEPLLVSSTMSPDKEIGRPKSEEPLSESGEKTRDSDANENRA